MVWSIEMLIIPLAINLIAAVVFFVAVQPKLEFSRTAANEREKNRIEYLRLVRDALLSAEHGFWMWSIINSDMQRLLLRLSIFIKMRIFVASFFVLGGLFLVALATYIKGEVSAPGATSQELTFIYSSGSFGLLMVAFAFYEFWAIQSATSHVEREVDSYAPLLDEIRQMVVAKATGSGHLGR